jgi:hypothetical protein
MKPAPPKQEPRASLPVLGPCIVCLYHSKNNGVMNALPIKVCTLYPPAVSFVQANTSAFPVVDDNWTCGSFLHI